MLVGWIVLLGAVGVSLSLAGLLAALVNHRIAQLVAVVATADPAASPPGAAAYRGDAERRADAGEGPRGRS